MTRQITYLPKYDWWIVVYYFPTARNRREILQCLSDLGCSGSAYKRASDNLVSEQPNSGLTYSSEDSRTTVMVIGNCTSSGELWNTLDHEKTHAVFHISKSNGLNPGSESVGYLAGDIASKLYPIASGFLCSGSRPDSKTCCDW